MTDLLHGQSSSELPKCDPRRYGKRDVIRCPHGCVTECERKRRAALLLDRDSGSEL